VGTQTAALEPAGDVLRLFSQAGAKHFPVFGILQESFLAADALDFIAKIQRAVVLAEGELLQFRPE